MFGMPPSAAVCSDTLFITGEKLKKKKKRDKDGAVKVKEKKEKHREKEKEKDKNKERELPPIKVGSLLKLDMQAFFKVFTERLSLVYY